MQVYLLVQDGLFGGERLDGFGVGTVLGGHEVQLGTQHFQGTVKRGELLVQHLACVPGLFRLAGGFFQRALIGFQCGVHVVQLSLGIVELGRVGEGALIAFAIGGRGGIQRFLKQFDLGLLRLDLRRESSGARGYGGG